MARFPYLAIFVLNNNDNVKSVFGDKYGTEICTTDRILLQWDLFLAIVNQLIEAMLFQ